MNEPLTIHEAHGLLKSKKLSSVELTRACLKRIKEVEPKVKALVSVTEELALKQAERADKRLAEGDGSPLTGIPVVLKDVPPFVTVAANSASPYGLNSEGLRRRGFAAETIRDLRRAYKVIYKQGHTTEQALEQLRPRAADCAHTARLVEFIESSSRGIVR